MASENTGMLHKFYKKNAVCSFGDSTSVTGSTNIREKLAALNGASFDLESPGVHYAFQPTADGGVLVMVTAFVTLRGNLESNAVAPVCRFMQTFLLVREVKEQEAPTFSIMNDMHRFLDTQVASPNHAGPAVVAPVETPTAQSTTSTSTPPAAVAATTSTSNTPTTKPAAEKSEKQPRSSIPAKESQKQARNNNAGKQQQAPAPSEPTVKTPPSSYAQAAKSSSNGPSATNKENATGAVPQRSVVTSPPPPNCAIWVKPSEAGGKVTEAGLTEAFKVYGNIVKIQLNPKGIATVTFAEPQSVTAAVEKKEQVVDGVPLQVEVFRSASRSGAGVKRSTSQSSAPTATTNNNAETKPVPSAAARPTQPGNSTRRTPATPTNNNSNTTSQPTRAAPTSAPTPNNGAAKPVGGTRRGGGSGRGGPPASGNTSNNNNNKTAPANPAQSSS